MDGEKWSCDELMVRSGGAGTGRGAAGSKRKTRTPDSDVGNKTNQCIFSVRYGIEMDSVELCLTVLVPFCPPSLLVKSLVQQRLVVHIVS